MTTDVPEFFTMPERGAFEEFLGNLPGPYFVVECEGAIVACGSYARGPASLQGPTMIRPKVIFFDGNETLLDLQPV